MGWRRQYPDSDEHKALFDGNFADYRLRISGLVANLVELDLAQLRALPHHEQITQHFCIQGWSGVAKWGGASMQTIVDLVEPHPEAKWVIFYSLQGGADKGVYYDAHPIEHMSHQHRRRCPIISAGFTNTEQSRGRHGTCSTQLLTAKSGGLDGSRR